MTDEYTENKKSTLNPTRPSAGQILFCVMSVAVLLLTFRHSELAISSMSGGMRLCVSTVIPALFPFMVLSELLVSSGAAKLVARIFGGVFEGLFGIRREGCIAFLLGIVCGFPIGTKSAVSLYENGKISRSELEHLLTFCNGPSSAFLISAVGVSLFSSREFGVMLYCAEIISATVIGAVGRVFFSHKKRDDEETLARGVRSQEESAGLQSVVSAVTSSASSMLYVCSFVVFFSSVTGILSAYADAAGLPRAIKTALIGFFEITGGVAAASSLPTYSACLCTAAIVGWSGLSVHFQLVSLCSDHKIAYRPYFLAKLIRGALDLILIAAGLAIFGDRIDFTGEFAPSFLSAPSLQPVHIITLTVFGIAAVKSLKLKRGK